MNEHATYRIGNAIAVTQLLPDGTWLATFPGFTGTGLAESDALAALAAEVEDASKQLRIQAIEVAATRADDAIAEAEAGPIAVIVRTYVHPPSGDVRGEVVKVATGEVLHQGGWGISRKEAMRDTEQIAQRKGYNVVKVSE